jgi:hypothetical protein
MSKLWKFHLCLIVYQNEMYLWLEVTVLEALCKILTSPKDHIMAYQQLVFQTVCRKLWYVTLQSVRLLWTPVSMGLNTAHMKSDRNIPISKQKSITSLLIHQASVIFSHSHSFINSSFTSPFLVYFEGHFKHARCILFVTISTCISKWWLQKSNHNAIIPKTIIISSDHAVFAQISNCFRSVKYVCMRRYSLRHQIK